MKYKFYKENENDTVSPVLEFLDNLSNPISARFYNCLEHLIQNKGITDGLSFRKLKNCLFEEIRIKESKSLHRVIIQIRFNDLIICLHGFTKKEAMNNKEHKKLLAKEIKEAIRRYNKLIRVENKTNHLI